MKLSRFLFCLLFLLPGSLVRAQNLMGTTGLVTIPTARMQEDGSLSFGVTYFDKKYQDYSNRMYDVGAVYSTINFLPFLEITLRINRMLDYPKNRNYTVDRVPMIRLRLLKEQKTFPAVTFGVHDFFAAFGGEKAKHYNATYLVMSKKLSRFDFHLGYAPELMDAGHYQLNGVFYGIDCALLKWVNLMGEYDTRYFNGGAAVRAGKHFQVNIGLMNGDSFAAGVNYRIRL
jgi:hypothetical protein